MTRSQYIKIGKTSILAKDVRKIAVYRNMVALTTGNTTYKATFTDKDKARHTFDTLTFRIKNFHNPKLIIYGYDHEMND